MDNNNKYKVGDILVEFGRVFTIYKIKKQENRDGEIEKFIFFKPFFKTKELTGLVCSIPEVNINKTGIRRAISKKEFRLLMKGLKKKSSEEYPALDIAKELLKSNDPADTVKIARLLWDEKKELEDNISKSKIDIFNSAVEKLSQEFASVFNVPLDKAKRTINLALQN